MIVKSMKTPTPTGPGKEGDEGGGGGRGEDQGKKHQFPYGLGQKLDRLPQL